MITTLTTLLLTVAFMEARNRRAVVKATRAAERAVVAAGAAREAKEAAGRLAGVRAFDAMGVKR